LTTVEFVFTGHWERFARVTYAVCDHAPLYIPGTDESDAAKAMQEAALDYVGVLVERGELEQAIQERHLDIELGAPPHSQEIRITEDGFTIRVILAIGGGTG
jgi:hypothetical protein